ncbi:hypothetical protein FXV77_05215 [Sphingobacterium phlebotomi]|uniref:Uncharacterized protein n=1 Tax=Sphingobacterium phlebotomi TaxID=2605433 RepID=A0A5D4H9V9_9SPHI|nr:hypothetical protein [Sphingobacterium phlebotomi]TYR37407.1 hypothetical protein FXV77_05215 [Sphingobacterium phlebotomi]
MKAQEKHENLTERMVKAIAGILVKTKLQIAKRLAQWEQKCSDLQKKFLFFLFLACGICYCTAILVDAWSSNDMTDTSVMGIGEPYKPPHLVPPVDTLDIK